METILTFLPIAYVYWASILMVWSILQAGITGNIVRIFKKRYSIYRQTDMLVMATMLMCAGMLYGSIFIVPHITALFVDIALVVALWYTVFLGTVSQFNLSSLLHIKRTK